MNLFSRNQKFELKTFLLIFVLIFSFALQCPRKTTERKQAKNHAFPDSIKADFPTDLVFTKEKLFFIEKGGALKEFEVGRDQPKTLTTINVPSSIGYDETGLLGIALSPDFLDNSQIYLYHTLQRNNQLFNRVIRINSNKPDQKPDVILDEILASGIHNGGKLAFGPDGKLYIATGEVGQKQLAQDKNSLNGKVLRINPDGSTPKDNPFDNEVWSLGHRNIFGMTFDNKGTLYVTENGPEANDEINKIEKGTDYGWPKIVGFGGSFKQPLIQYEDSIAPTGIIFYKESRYNNLKNRLIFADFLDGNIHRLSLSNNRAKDKIIARSEGKINALAQTPDGFIYVATRNSIKKLDFN